MTVTICMLVGAMVLRSSWSQAGTFGYFVDFALFILAGLVLLHARVTFPVWLAPLSQSARHAPVSLLAAFLVFAFSVWATVPSPLQYWRRLWMQIRTGTARHHRRAAQSAILVACHEEVVWRLVCQSALHAVLGAPIAVILVALLFAWWHRRRTAGTPRLMGELGAFSLMLGVSFAATGDLLLVLLLHALRNYLIGMNGRHEYR